MTYTAYRTWTTGEALTAALMNEQIRDNGLEGAAAAAAAAGDVFYADEANSVVRLAKGADGEFLGLSGGLPVWATPPGALAAYKSANENRSSSASGGESDADLAVSALANSDYLYYLDAYYTAPSSGYAVGTLGGITLPAGAALVSARGLAVTEVPTTYVDNFPNEPFAGDTFLYRKTGYISVGSTAGTVAHRWGNTGAGTLTLLQGSTLLLVPVG